MGGSVEPRTLPLPHTDPLANRLLVAPDYCGPQGIELSLRVAALLGGVVGIVWSWCVLRSKPTVDLVGLPFLTFVASVILTAYGLLAVLPWTTCL